MGGIKIPNFYASPLNNQKLTGDNEVTCCWRFTRYNGLKLKKIVKNRKRNKGDYGTLANVNKVTLTL